MLASVLQAASYRVGLYTSPHLVSYRERIQINRSWVDEAEFQALADQLMPCAEAMNDKPSQFEFLTAMSFLYFAQKKVDWAVVEVGLGGRFDATIVIDPEVAVLTNVELDHTDLLGDTLAKIAWEKIGIAKPGVPLVTGEEKTEPRQVIERECAAVKAQLVLVKTKLERLDFDWKSQIIFDTNLGPIRLGLLGGYQLRNAAIAITALRELQKPYSLPDRAIIEGLEKARWAGRFEALQELPYVVLDGAHNPHGASALRDDIQHYAKKFLLDAKKYLLFGMLADKDFSQAAQFLFPEFDEIFLVKPASPRALEPAVLADIAKQLGKVYCICDSVESAFGQIRKKLDARDLLCVAGSLYLVGEVEEYLGHGHTTIAHQH
jgi:dihydrofolate synthase/folylpolyglutamate synthase